MFAQEDKNKLFSSTGVIEAKMSFSPKKIRKMKSDTVYVDTQFQYKTEGQWNEMSIGIRARGILDDLPVTIRQSKLI